MATRKLTEEEQMLFEETVAVGRAMQHKFRPEPLFKHTGKGYMKSDLVAETARLKEEIARAKDVAR